MSVGRSVRSCDKLLYTITDGGSIRALWRKAYSMRTPNYEYWLRIYYSQIYEEALPVLYGENTFTFKNPKMLQAFRTEGLVEGKSPCKRSSHMKVRSLTLIIVNMYSKSSIFGFRATYYCRLSMSKSQCDHDTVKQIRHLQPKLPGIERHGSNSIFVSKITKHYILRRPQHTRPAWRLPRCNHQRMARLLQSKQIQQRTSESWEQCSIPVAAESCAGFWALELRRESSHCRWFYPQTALNFADVAQTAPLIKKFRNQDGLRWVEIWGVRNRDMLDRLRTGLLRGGGGQFVCIPN